MSIRVWAGLAAALFAVIALVALSETVTIPSGNISTSGVYETVSCGSATSPVPQLSPERQAVCDDKLGGRQAGGTVLLVLAGLAVVGGVASAARRRLRRPASAASAATPDARP